MIATYAGRIRGIQWTFTRVVLVAVVVVLATFVTHNVIARANTVAKMPQNAAMEDALGIRVTRVAVVGDGGLITVTYVVLDSEKAARFQTDSTHPPVLTSESRSGGTKRVSLMRQGHNLRDGQTYYLVYQNTKGAIRAGEKVTVAKGKFAIANVPVL